MARRGLDSDPRSFESPLAVLPAPGWALAHDLAGGVRGIVQLCGLIETQHPCLPPDAARQFAAIGQRARRLQRFIRDLQELDRQRQPNGAALVADPAAVVREVMAGLEPDLAALRPRLHIGALPALAVAAPDLARLLGNLIINALQHRSPLKPRLVITSQPHEGMIELAVTDNGPGVPALMQTRVFEPFVRLPSSRSQPGSGLGLAICRAIAQSYGGRIWVEPAAGGGSRFCCTLPPAEPLIGPAA
jgi:signal transduction histidine kinase